MSSGEYGQADGAGRLLAGRYRVVAQLGRGGMGVVWRAVDEVLGREVAVKELRTYTDAAGPELADLRLRMQREARAAARVRHPGVVAVHDIAEVDGRPLIVMELVDGPSLDDVLRDRGTLDPREAAGIGAKVLDALAAAHRVGVLHRDVKPGNILLDRSGRVLLTDFGIATMEDPGDGSATHLTRSGELVGSLDYLAPERAQGADPGPASDVWALGATLYAAVEGASPFRRTSTYSTLTAIVAEPLPEPRRAGPLGPVLRRLMDKRPESRPEAEEAREFLQAVADAPAADLPTALLRGAAAGARSREEPTGRPETELSVPAVPPGFGPVQGASGGAAQAFADGQGVGGETGSGAQVFGGQPGSASQASGAAARTEPGQQGFGAPAQTGPGSEGFGAPVRTGPGSQGFGAPVRTGPGSEGFGAPVRTGPGSQGFGAPVRTGPGSEGFGAPVRTGPGSEGFGAPVRTGPGSEGFGAPVRTGPGSEGFGAPVQTGPGSQGFGASAQTGPGSQGFGASAQTSPGPQRYGAPAHTAPDPQALHTAGPSGPTPPATSTPTGPVPALAPRRKGRALLAAAAVVVVLAAAGVTVLMLDNSPGEATAGVQPTESIPRATAAPSATGPTEGGGSADAKPSEQGAHDKKTPTAEQSTGEEREPAPKDTAPSKAASPSQTAGDGTTSGGSTGGGTETTPAPSCHSIGGGKYNCTVWRTAKSYTASGTEVGILNAGTNYFYCQQNLGRRETYGEWTNVWWGRTDDDSGNAGVYVSAVYIQGGDNDAPVPGLPVC
ncbi:serine/threonine-protein kinase [Streptomyces sp. Z423-1]|uniref:serine/threonine-protein kinase n=1 Tax=Streptomyces sp. Z423-1 TaxID=2730915 RepID=UPI001F1132B6|nr:serine/threonine-protein kinase [Streptomyces sp. Z423-1]